MSPQVEKLVMTLVGAALVAAAAWPPLAPAAMVFSTIGGTILGKYWMASTEERELRKASTRPAVDPELDEEDLKPTIRERGKPK